MLLNFLYLSYSRFLKRIRRFILFVSQGGSELCILTVLFGIYLFARSVKRSVIYMAYASISSFSKASQLVSASSRVESYIISLIVQIDIPFICWSITFGKI